MVAVHTLTPTVRITVDKSLLFTAYNCARRLAREHKLDEGRLNRGFGLALSKEFQVDYHNYISTDRNCNCPDATYRDPITCKHQIAIALLSVARIEVA